MLLNAGISEQGLINIALAVTYHSMNEEIDANHPAYKTTALLKDADALDRIRIGENNLNIKFLRLPESADHIAFARKLFYASNHFTFNSFGDLMKFAGPLV
jgi:hypothetical protein